MDIFHLIKRRLRQVIFPLFGASIACYFVYHAIQGDRGVIAWLRVNQELQDAKATYATIEGQRATLEQRVALLSNSSLDLDMLEERARVMLNFTHPDDIVLLRDGASVVNSLIKN